MILEFVGLPGCGKTTLAKSVKALGKRSGLEIILPYNSSLEEHVEKPVPRYVKRSDRRRLLYNSIRFRERFRDLNRFVEDKFRDDFEDGSTSMQFLYVLNGVIYQNALALDGIYLFDESFLHRGTAFVQNEVDLATYLSLIPPADLTVHLKLEPEAAFERSIARREAKAGKFNVREKMHHKFGEAGEARPLENLQRRQLYAVDALRQRNCAVLDLDATIPTGLLAQEVVEAILRVQEV